VPRCWRGAAGWSCEGRRGRGCPGPDTAPTDPVQGTAEPRSHPGDTSGEMYLRTGKTAFVGDTQGKRERRRDPRKEQQREKQGQVPGSVIKCLF